MKIAILQLDPLVGAIEQNAAAIIEKTQEAYSKGARLVLTPELALCGFPPADLLLRPSFMQACDEAVTHIIDALSGYGDLYLLLGHPVALQRVKPNDVLQRYNAISIIHAGAIQDIYAKQVLADAQTAANSRYFVAGDKPTVFQVEGIDYGVLIGGDIALDKGVEQPVRKAIEAGAKALLLPIAQPYHIDFQKELEQHIAGVAKTLRIPIIVAQMAGGQDELVFGGASFAVDEKGDVRARAKSFEEDVFYLDALCKTTPTKNTHCAVRGEVQPLLTTEEAQWRALVTGLRAYTRKNGFKQVVMGLSGGMDSALVLAIAVDAVGAENVSTVMMPSPYTADISVVDAQEMAKRLGVKHQVIPIVDICETFQQTLAPAFAALASMPSTLQAGAADTTDENIQARARGVILMALSNKTGALVLASGNKSELATGYCTLYGDTVGGFSVIKDLPKTRVYMLASWRNKYDLYKSGAKPIPQRIITRPPSAELRPNQTDQDSLPTYEILDGIMERYVEQNMSVENIVKSGFSLEDVEKVIYLIKISEYKRRQAPIGVKLTRRSFGGDWRYPITSAFRA